MGRDAEKRALPSAFKLIEGFVDVRIHQTIDFVAGMDMNEIDIVRPQSTEALVDDFFVALDRRPSREVPDRGAELRRQEDLIPREVLERATNGEFAAFAE